MAKCIGCGNRDAKPHSYCAVCRDRMAHGTPIDYDELITVKDLGRMRQMFRRLGWRSSWRDRVGWLKGA